MALSGTLETFSLPDVLRLLSSTKKTGLLALDGDRGWGRVWVDGGEIVAAQAERAAVSDVDGVLFELLRFDRAGFEFDTTAELPDGAGAPRGVEEALAVAEERLAEWREIEAVVPSLDVRVRMVAEIAADVTVAPDDWRVLARVGTGASGHDVARHLEQGEYDVCRRLRDLVDAGVVEVTEEAAGEPAAEVADAFAAMVHAPAADEAPVYEVIDGGDDDAVTEAPVADHLGAEAPGIDDPLTDEPAADEPVAEGLADADAEGPEVLSDLAHLSPRAAAAVEAAWGSEDESTAAPADEDTDAPATGGDDLDQNLLLRFLSSSKP